MFSTIGYAYLRTCMRVVNLSFTSSAEMDFVAFLFHSFCFSAFLSGFTPDTCTHTHLSFVSSNLFRVFPYNVNINLYHFLKFYPFPILRVCCVLVFFFIPFFISRRFQ